MSRGSVRGRVTIRVWARARFWLRLMNILRHDTPYSGGLKEVIH